MKGLLKKTATVVKFLTLPVTLREIGGGDGN